MATMQINKGQRCVTCGLGRQLRSLLRYRWSEGHRARVECTRRGLVSSLLPAAWVLGSGTRAHATLTLSLGT